MKSWARNTTISQKLWFLSSIALILVVLLVYSIFMSTSRAQLMAALNKKAESVTRLLANNLGAGLYLNDDSYLQKIVSGVQNDPDVAFVAIFDKSGKRRYFFRTQVDSLPPDSTLLHLSAPTTFHRYLLIKQPIAFYNEFQGYLVAGFSLAWVDANLAGQKRRIVLGIAVFAVVLILLTLAISNFIVSPIRQAIEQLGNYNFESNQQLRFPEKGRDELSQLGVTFNRLIGQIEQNLNELQESRQYVETVLDLSPVPLMVVNDQGVILNASSSIKTLLEVDSQALVGKSLREVLPAGDVDIIFSQIAAGRQLINNYITSLENASGQTKIVELNISPIKGSQPSHQEFIFALIDITEKIETQREILEHQNRLQKYNRELSQKTRELGIANEKIKRNARKLDQLIQISQEIIRASSIADVLKVLTHQGRELIEADKTVVFYWNPRQKKLVPSLSYPADYVKELKSISNTQCVVYRCFEENESFLLNEDGINQTDYQLLNLPQSKPASIIALPLSEKDYKFGVTVFIKENSGMFYIEDLNFITTLVHQAAIALDKIYLLQAFREKAKNLEKAYQELKATQQQILQLQKMESLGTLVGGIAHDFNNILGIIVPNLDLMRMRARQDPELLKRIMIIQDTVERAADLTRQLLMFSRNQDVNLKPLQLNQLLTRIARMLKRTLGKHIEIKTELDENLPLIQADETRLTQVIVNLAVNARDAMPDGGVLTIKTEYGQFRPSRVHGKKGKYVRVVVQDTGTGIKKDHLDKIFDPFFTTKSVGKGTGLGLSVVYGIVQSHNGYIDVETEENVGTRFLLYFKPYHGKLPRKKEVKPVSLPRGTETLLIVDDEEMIRESLKDILESFGYTVLLAENGKRAVEIIQKGQKVDLAIIDYAMPGMNGIETIEKLRQINGKIKMVISSGFAESKEVFESKIAIDGFLPKPYHIVELTKKIRKILSAKTAVVK